MYVQSQTTKQQQRDDENNELHFCYMNRLRTLPYYPRLSEQNPKCLFIAIK